MCSFSVQFKAKGRKIRHELFNFKNEADKMHFKRETSVPGSLSYGFRNSTNFTASSNTFFRNLKKGFYKCFHKIRIRDEPRKLYGDRIVQTILQVKKSVETLKHDCECKIGQ